MQPVYLTLAGNDLEDDLERLRRATVAEGAENTGLHTLAAAATLTGGWRRLVLTLAERGVPVDAKNRMGQTALARAVARGNAEMTQALLECGADWLITDQEGLSPLERAWEKVGSETQAVMEAWIKRTALLGKTGIPLSGEEENNTRM